MPATAGRRKHFSMIREFHVADFFTLANAACGVAAVKRVAVVLQSGVRAWAYVDAHFQDPGSSSSSEK